MNSRLLFSGSFGSSSLSFILSFLQLENYFFWSWLFLMMFFFQPLIQFVFSLFVFSFDCLSSVRVLEDDLWRKTTFDARRPLTKDDLRWRWPLTEDIIWPKTTFDWRRPLMEDNIWKKTTLDGRRPLTKDDIWQKMTFDERWHLTKVNLWWNWLIDLLSI